MNSCEECILAEDVADFVVGNVYVAALGIFLPAIGPYVGKITSLTGSQLKRYKSGAYAWQVLDEEKLLGPYSKKSVIEATVRMAKRYGPFSEAREFPVFSHDERVRIANSVSQELIKRPYVDSVYLTGSTALDLDRLDSDVDLLTILAACPGKEGHQDMDNLIEDSQNSSNPVDVFYMQKDVLLEVRDFQTPLIQNRVLLASR